MADKPRIDSVKITILSGPHRKKPKVGDEKIVKGVTMIRQWVRTSDGFLVRRGSRLALEWVEKGGERDRGGL